MLKVVYTIDGLYSVDVHVREGGPCSRTNLVMEHGPRLIRSGWWTIHQILSRGFGVDQQMKEVG